MKSSFDKAVQEFQSHHFSKAKKHCARALKENPKNAAAHHLMGATMANMKNLQHAASHFESAVQLDPSLIEAKLNLGKTYRDLGRHSESVRIFAAVTKDWPTRGDVWVELGIALERTDQMIEAIKAYEQAIELGIAGHLLFHQLGSAYLACGNFEKAENTFNRAIETDPNFAPAWINLAITKENLDQLDTSLDIYAALLRKDPQYSEAAYRQALGFLSAGRLSEGWNAYASRGQWAHTRTCHGESTAPFWNGEDISKKKLLLWTEQGPGDELLFGSMISDAVSKCADITLACSERLEPLFSRSFPECRVVTRTDTTLPTNEIGACDVQASLTELGLNTRPSLNSFGGSQPYLKIDADRRDALREKYSGGDRARPLIGISWRSANEVAGHQKSTGLLEWANMMDSVDANFFNLQYGDTHDEIATLKTQTDRDLLSDPDIDPLSDMDGFTHQVAAMDIVISTSNTTVHVAGALGQEVWTLVPTGTGRPWYWFLDRSDSLWYPSMTLYRQPKAGDWSAPLALVHKNLADWMHRWQPLK